MICIQEDQNHSARLGLDNRNLPFLHNFNFRGVQNAGFIAAFNHLAMNDVEWWQDHKGGIIQVSTVHTKVIESQHLVSAGNCGHTVSAILIVTNQAAGRDGY